MTEAVGKMVAFFIFKEKQLDFVCIQSPALNFCMNSLAGFLLKGIIPLGSHTFSCLLVNNTQLSQGQEIEAR